MTDTKKPLAATAVITPDVRLSFPKLFVPAPRTKEVKVDAEGKAIQPELFFQATLLLPPKFDLAPMHKAMAAAMIAKWGSVIKLPAAKNPIHDCAEKESVAGYAEGWHYLNTSSKRRPSIVNRLGEPVTDETLVYPGLWIKAYLGCYAWAHPTGGKGVSFGLNAIQIVRDDERLDGYMTATDVFEPLDAPEASGSADTAEMFG